MLELGVAIRVRRTLAGLAVGLQAVPQILEQFCHQAMADLVALAVEFRSQLAHTLAGPAQGRLWIAATIRFDQLFQIVDQGRILVDRPLAPATGLADAPDTGHSWLTQFLEAAGDGATRHARRTRHGRYATIAQGFGLGRRIEPPQPFIQKGLQAGKSLFDEVCVHAGQYSTSRHTTQTDRVIS